MEGFISVPMHGNSKQIEKKHTHTSVEYQVKLSLPAGSPDIITTKEGKGPQNVRHPKNMGHDKTTAKNTCILISSCYFKRGGVTMHYCNWKWG